MGIERTDESSDSDLATAPSIEGVYPGADDDASSVDLPRTYVHTAEETEAILTGSDGFDPVNFAGPPAGGDYSFKPQPDAVHIEGPAVDIGGKPAPKPTEAQREQLDKQAPYESLTPADGALVNQGVLESYAGSDEWRNTMRGDGDRVWFGAAGPHQDGVFDKGVSGFGVPEGDLPSAWKEVAGSARLDARAYSEATQVSPGGDDNNYRGWLHCYEFTKDYAVAEGIATENTQFGGGGTPQVYVPDIRQAVQNGTLRCVGQMQMTNTDPDWSRLKHQ